MWYVPIAKSRSGITIAKCIVHATNGWDCGEGLFVALQVCAVGRTAAFKACLRREWTLMTRHSFIYIFRTCQVHAHAAKLASCTHTKLAAARWYAVFQGYFPQGSGVEAMA